MVDSGSSDPSESERIKVGANQQKLAVLEARSLTATQFVDIARWIIASLLAVNSGGLLTVLNTEAVSLEGKFWSGLFFALGLCAALLTGYANMRSAKSAMPEINKQFGYWFAVSLDGERDEELEQELEADWKKAARGDFVADGLGWLSFLLLLCGLAIGGANLVDTEGKKRDSQQTVKVIVSHD